MTCSMYDGWFVTDGGNTMKIEWFFSKTSELEFFSIKTLQQRKKSVEQVNVRLETERRRTHSNFVA